MGIQEYLNEPVPRWLALAGIVSVGVAATGITYFSMKKRTESRFLALLEQEVERTEKFYAEKKPDLSSLVSDIAEDARVMETLNNYREMAVKYAEKEPVEEGLREVAHNVFTDADDDENDPRSDDEFDYEEQERLKEAGKPYVLEHDQFFSSDYQSSQLTWYEGDSVLADDTDKHINDIGKLMGGTDNLKWGYGSHDWNIVYIRNDDLELDFEVVKATGKYTEQVMGFMHVHEDRRKGAPKFRVYDD